LPVDSSFIWRRTLPCFWAGSRVCAQTYPAQPVRLLVPVTPGGALDIVARSRADKMKTIVGTKVIENLAGGGGSLGAAAVAHARPDGYTILLRGWLIDPSDGVATQEPAAL
jgi:tripartite-type tricarboxylate transporter receptor subunit TctC